MQVDKGQILGFIGPNGAGKTTTIRILVGLSKATSGRATIAGCDCLTDSRKIKRIVGYMPDDFGKYNNMRVSEYLDFFGAAYAIGRRDRVRRIDETLEIAGATHMKDLFVDALSRGMQQRVAIARTLIHDPQMIILDEPANGLDPQARIDMREILLRLAELGKTLIVTSHILPELARVCDLVAMITKGKLRAFGTVDDIMRDIKQRRTFEVLLLDGQSVEPVATQIRKWLDQKEPTGLESKQNAEATQAVTADSAQTLVRFETSLTDNQLSELLNQLVASDHVHAIARLRLANGSREDAVLSVRVRSAKGDANMNGWFNREFYGILSVP
ncbi:UNVERIFIED_CONTAM: hypothetical protein GTU68_028075 [Idotea baltica]|nr:hypothetical protein [Idotea baltica]